MEEENKLIAEFMGYKLERCRNGLAWDIGRAIPAKDHLFPIQGLLHTGRELKFHTEWNWLMSVVEKIEDIEDEFRQAKYNVNTVQCFVEIVDNRNSEEIVVIDGNNRKQATFKAVVEFIKWYNERLYNERNRFICGSCGEHCSEYTYNKDKDVDECNDCIN